MLAPHGLSLDDVTLVNVNFSLSPALMSGQVDAVIGAFRNKDGLDDELNRRALRDTLPRFALRPAALDTRRYDTMAKFLIEQGVVEDVPATDTYAVELR